MIAVFIDREQLLAHETEKGQLYQATVSLLRARGNVRKAAKDAGVPYHWTWKLAAGTLAHADVTRIERLFKHLSKVDAL